VPAESVLVHRGLSELPRGLRMALTVGVFDGMHRGHLSLLAATVREARAWDATPVAVTFEPHPDALFRGAPPPRLCDEQERLERLAAAGIAHIVVERFDAAFAAQSASEFLASIRRGRDLAGLVMTTESAFGRGREGTAEALSELGRRDGFRVAVVSPLVVGGQPVSASRIRDLLAAGRLAAASGLLGRRAAVIGTVVRGDGRGRDLGFPTANVEFEAPVVLPPDGIYAAKVTWGGPAILRPRRQATGVASLGVRPTFGGGERLLEVHLFDFDELLYGERLRIVFVRRQRGERHYHSVAALVAQMERDGSRARQLLASDRSPGGSFAASTIP